MIIIGIPKYIVSGKMSENKYYIVMGLHDHDSSTLKMKFRTTSNHNVILSLGQAILKTLEKIHAVGYVHCDIKPSNILYDVKNNTEYNFTLVDYGIWLRYLNKDYTHIKKTVLPSVSGSVEFIATECLKKLRKSFNL